MQEVDVNPRSLDQLISMMTTERAGAFAESGRRARAAFGDRTIWHVNATAHGGGVAEMLQAMAGHSEQTSAPATSASSPPTSTRCSS